MLRSAGWQGKRASPVHGGVSESMSPPAPRSPRGTLLAALGHLPVGMAVFPSHFASAAYGRLCTQPCVGCPGHSLLGVKPRCEQRGPSSPETCSPCVLPGREFAALGAGAFFLAGQQK